MGLDSAGHVRTQRVRLDTSERGRLEIIKACSDVDHIQMAAGSTTTFHIPRKRFPETSFNLINGHREHGKIRP